MKLLISTIFAVATVSQVAFGQNYLTNPGFETWNPNNYGGYTFTQTGVGFDPIGASPWEFFNFTSGTTTADRATPPAGLTGSGNYSSLVTSDTAGNGVIQGTYQVVNGFNVPVTYDYVSGWVYVTQGSAGIGWFDQDAQQSHIVASTSVLNQWVFLSAGLPAVQSWGFEIVATSANSDFYADNMDAEPTPEPACFALLGLGALGLLRRGRKRA